MFAYLIVASIEQNYFNALNDALLFVDCILIFPQLFPQGSAHRTLRAPSALIRNHRLWLHYPILSGSLTWVSSESFHTR
jgi:hypothetical protein